MVCFVFALKRVLHHRNTVLFCQGVLSSPHLKNVMTLWQEVILGVRNLSRSVKEYCNDCLTCAKSKPRRKPKAPLQPVPSGYPMQRLLIDKVGPLPRTKRGSRFILTVQCSFTKWAEAYAIPNQRASTCAKVLIKNWICWFVVPDSVHSDQGRNFESTVFQETCMLLGINKTRSTAYHPEGNGQVENLHRTMKRMLTARAEEQPGAWDEQLDLCMMAYRSSVHASTVHSPFELIFGHEMRIPLDVMMGNADETESTYTKFVVDLRERLIQAHQDVREKLKVAQRRQKDAFDKGVKYTVYQPGDLVLRFSPQIKPSEPNKFHRQWEGPYEIVERVSEVTYRVRRRGRLSRRSSVVHFNNLRLYKMAADVSRKHGKPADSVQNHADTIAGVGGQTSVSDNEENVFESERTGDPSPAEGPQETADESSLPGDCLEERALKVFSTLLTNKSSLTGLVTPLIPHLALRILNCICTKHFAPHGCESDLIVTGIGC